MWCQTMLWRKWLGKKQTNMSAYTVSSEIAVTTEISQRQISTSETSLAVMWQHPWCWQKPFSHLKQLYKVQPGPTFTSLGLWVRTIKTQRVKTFNLLWNQHYDWYEVEKLILETFLTFSYEKYEMLVFLIIIMTVKISHVQLFSTPWTAARQAPLSMEFFMQRILEWVAIPFSNTRDNLDIMWKVWGDVSEAYQAPI